MDPLYLLKAINLAIVHLKDLQDICFKPKQIKCFEYLLNKIDVIAVLPTGYGKSLIYQLLPFIIPTKSKRNFVIVVCPLTSIIEDQLKYLSTIGIKAAVLNLYNFNDQLIESLFPMPIKSCVDDETTDKILSFIQEGNIDVLFAHPESLLCEEGRDLLKSKTYKDNVVACVIDEVHCVEDWGSDFRTDFMELSSLRALFPDIPVLGLTATAPPEKILNLKNILCMRRNCKVISVNPNRKNIYISLNKRPSNKFNWEGYEDILTPIALKLLKERNNYNMTIIYMKLKYCGYAYSLFEKLIPVKSQYIGQENVPANRLFCQYHAPQTAKMKKEILSEIVKSNSKIRVIFATAALGMGVNTPYVRNIIHITPPCSLESYMQEIGRAGRLSQQSFATLYFNNQDIGENRKKVENSMKLFCENKKSCCLREMLLKHFGFEKTFQSYCCSICDPHVIYENITPLKNIYRNLSVENKLLLKSSVSKCIQELNEVDMFLVDVPQFADNVVDKIVDSCESISQTADLLTKFDIWDEQICSKIYNLIEFYAPSFVADKRL